MSPACLRSLRDVQKAGKAEGGAKQSPAHGSFYLGFPERRTFVFVGCFGQATRTKEAEEPAAEENSAVPLASKRPAGQGSKSPPPRASKLPSGLPVNPSGRGLARQKRSGAISSTTGEGLLEAWGDAKFKMHRS